MEGGYQGVVSRVYFNRRDITTDTYYRLKNIPGLLRLLKTVSTVAAIDSREMAVLYRLMINSKEIGFSSAL